MGKKKGQLAKALETPKKSSTKKSVEVPPHKPSMSIDGIGNLKVGQKTKIMVSGTVVEETIREYDKEGKHVFRLEIDSTKKAK